MPSTVNCSSMLERGRSDPVGRIREGTAGRLKNPARSTCPRISTLRISHIPHPHRRRYNRRRPQEAPSPEEVPDDRRGASSQSAREAGQRVLHLDLLACGAALRSGTGEARGVPVPASQWPGRGAQRGAPRSWGQEALAREGLSLLLRERGRGGGGLGGGEVREPCSIPSARRSPGGAGRGVRQRPRSRAHFVSLVHLLTTEGEPK